MEKEIKLGSRLQAAADFVLPSLSTADIGTDHAYLPVYLVLKGVLTTAFASDVKEGPLNNARQTIEKYALSDKITLRLSDGLSAYKKGEVEQVVICGMGGELIAKILLEWEYVKTPNMHLILQPMTKPEALRQYLAQNGFEIKQEKGVFDEGRYYTIISAFYTGKSTPCTDLYLAIGKLSQVKTPESEGYKKMYLRRLQKKIDGIAKQNPESEELKPLERLREEIEKTL